MAQKVSVNLEKIERCLFLNTKTMDFVMIYKIKVHVLSNLLCQIFISRDLDKLNEISSSGFHQNSKTR